MRAMPNLQARWLRLPWWPLIVGALFSLLFVLAIWLGGVFSGSGSGVKGAGTWLPDASENIGPLYGIAAIAPDDVWAVGSTRNSPMRALALHWNGVDWSGRFPLTDGVNDASFRGIAALSSSDVWAVGFARVNVTETSPLLAHWDGASWVVHTPADLHLQLGSLELEAVDATAPDNVWAVGQNGLVLHWDGKVWKLVLLPESAAYRWLYGVDAISSDDVWVTGVGYILHWDGARWTDTTPSSRPGSYAEVTYKGITMLSDHDGWAIGSWSTPTDRVEGGIVVLRWDGSGWNETPDATANPADRDYYKSLYAAGFCCDLGRVMAIGGMSVIDEKNIWAVGGLTAPLVAHWDGLVWTSDACPSGEYVTTTAGGMRPDSMPGFGGPLYDVATISNGVAWAVGAIYDGPGKVGSGYVLDLRHGPCPTPVPTTTFLPIAVRPTSRVSEQPTYPPQPTIVPVDTVIMPFSQATVPIPVPSGVIPNPVPSTMPQP
jgi:hypothetical protein